MFDAIINNEVKKVAILMHEDRFNANILNEDGFTPLVLAAKWERLQVKKSGVSFPEIVSFSRKKVFSTKNFFLGFVWVG